MSNPLPPTTWEALGLSEQIRSLIEKAGFASPTPVQQQVIPVFNEGVDLMVSAQTGTGKTAAFVLPLVERLMNRKGTYVVVLAPSREIALQTHEVFQTFGAPLGVRSIALIGGIEMKEDAKALETYPHVIVATPGRLCDHLDRGNIWLDYVEWVVLDEADRMLDMGFSDQLNRILQDTPSSRQTLLFSATLPPTVDRLAQKILKDPKRIQIGRPTSTATTVDQRFIFTDERGKLFKLLHLLGGEKGSTMIFVRSKLGASQLWRTLRSRGIYDATQMHSDMRQRDREQSLEDFKAGQFRIMIATDVVGRGIHVEGVAHVVNYDLPMDAADYVHRIGRTGRAGQTGTSTTFVTPRDEPSLREIEALTGKTIARPENLPQLRDRGPRSRPGSSRPPRRR
jgi:superfamily II DNA/RNA helicase